MSTDFGKERDRYRRNYCSWASVTVHGLHQHCVCKFRNSRWTRIPREVSLVPTKKKKVGGELTWDELGKFRVPPTMASVRLPSALQ
jgi:hypothetical protein